jgi:HD-GYP domain-containing protein (c-di-GMP phosphodiesterase class II)
VATYGWGHDVFNAMILLYAVLDVAVIVYACRMRRVVSLKNLFAMFMLELVTVSSFIVSRQMENDMLCMPFVYLLDQVFLLYISLNVKWYDIARSVMQALDKDNGNAFVSFTPAGEYLGCNAIALKFFPKLSQCRVDVNIPDKHEMGALFNPLLQQYVGVKSHSVLKFWYGNRHFKCTARTIPLWNVTKICLFRIEDDTSVQMYVDMLGKSHNQLVKVVEQNAQAVSAIQEQMIVGMANMVESRDGNTGGHIKRTSQVIRILASEMRKDMAYGQTDSFYDALISAAPMHDLGKIAIDDEILRKPGRFTDDEFAQMKTHAEKGAVIVENLLAGIEDPFFVQLSKNVAHYHHERFDGTGYPQGLKGEEIPVEARIMAVADVYDALVSSRCYKDSMSYDKAGDIILDGMGKQFDPTLQKYFIYCEASLRDYYRTVEH